jgi:5-deoxy-D-glucuronate isomerase
MNKKIPSDLNRKIRLEGVGEVSRPVDIDQSVTGFSQLVSLRIYKFLSGQIINGEAEDDEVCIVFLSGDVTMKVTGKEHHSWTLQGRNNVFDGLPHVVYLPPHYHYKLSPHTDAEVAYARAKAEGRFPPRLITPGMLEQNVSTRGTNTHQAVQILREGEAEKLLCREFHLDQEHEQVFEKSLSEQLLHVRLSSPDSNAFAKLSNANETLRHGDTLAIDAGEQVTIHAADCELYCLRLSVAKPSN